jgi:predicted TPR repeat methyltransferase
MKRADGISGHDQEAHLYDQQVREYECYAHDILFGMGFEYVRPGERLLDLGIGTGLASLPFAKAGLEVFGLDGSAEMLRACESKGFAKELKCLSLLETPLPYSDCFFSHVISCGVFHFLDDLAPIVKEVSRIVGRHGVFAFTVVAPPVEKEQIAGDDMDGCREIDTAWGVSICTHSDKYVSGLLQDQGFETLKRQRFLMRGGKEDEDDMLFAAYVARKC